MDPLAPREAAEIKEPRGNPLIRWLRGRRRKSRNFEEIHGSAGSTGVCGNQGSKNLEKSIDLLAPREAAEIREPRGNPLIRWHHGRQRKSKNLEEIH